MTTSDHSRRWTAALPTSLSKSICTGSLVLAMAAGCDNTPPPPRVPVPSQGTPGPVRYDPAKPLPGQIPQQVPQPAPQQQLPPPAASPVPPPAPPPAPQGYPLQTPPPAAPPPSAAVPQPAYAAAPVSYYDPRIAAPPAGQLALPQPPPPAPAGFDDQPILRDRPPEQRAFVEAYNRVGRPRIAVYVNRTLDGQIVAPSALEPAPAVRVDRSVNWNYSQGTASDQINVYLKPGQYDEASARALDYQAIETVLTDWLAAGGNTELISPTLARARLTQEQRDALEKGEKFVLTDITQRLDADIFVQVQAQPTRQTARGLEVRLVAEAINTRGGRSIGRAVVDVPPPLEKTQINEYTRYLARKLMDDMILAWSATPPSGPTTRP